MLATAWITPDRPAQVILIVSGAAMFLLAVSFRELTVEDEGDSLLIQFGPLPLFRLRVPYAEIDEVQQGRTTILDGWGIHLSPSGGWTWNLWGFDCVDLPVQNPLRNNSLFVGLTEVECDERFSEKPFVSVPSKRNERFTNFSGVAIGPQTEPSSKQRARAISAHSSAAALHAKISPALRPTTISPEVGAGPGLLLYQPWRRGAKKRFPCEIHTVSQIVAE
jgi:hypothetical protein